MSEQTPTPVPLDLERLRDVVGQFAAWPDRLRNIANVPTVPLYNKAAQVLKDVADGLDEVNLAALLSEIESLRSDREGYKKRVTEQRRQIARMSRKIESFMAEAPPEPSEEDIHQRQLVYIERIEEARKSGNVDWLANELLEQDREKQVLIAKNETNKQNLSSVRRLRSEKSGAEKRANAAESKLERLERIEAAARLQSTECLNETMEQDRCGTCPRCALAAALSPVEEDAR